MYEAGSVFLLEADEEIPEENFRKVEQEGLGIRTAEGFGQVAFMADFGKLTYKHPMERKAAAAETVDTPASAENQLKKISVSQQKDFYSIGSSEAWSAIS